MLDILISEFGDPFSALPWQVAALRLAAALVLGGVIGWERELQLKDAGLRTHMLVAMAACLFTLVAFDLMQLSEREPDTRSVDPLRLVDAVTSGVAFLCAGLIMGSRERVRGLTTGAGLWLAGAIGLTCGVGNLPLAAMATVIALAILSLLQRVSDRISAQGEEDMAE